MTEFARDSIIKSKPKPNAIDFDRRKDGLRCVAEFIAGVPVDSGVLKQLFDCFERPIDLVNTLNLIARDQIDQIVALGPIETRFILVRSASVNKAFLFGNYDHNALPANVLHRVDGIVFESNQSFEFSDLGDVFGYVKKPSLFFAALYHPENFPLPRFSLAISDLIRSARLTGAAHIVSRDMQLGASIDSLVTDILEEKPDILGISATFGQQDVLDDLMRELDARGAPEGMQIVFGGSLCALNSKILLETYPKSIVAIGAGENTVADLIAVKRGEKSRDELTGIAYLDENGRAVSTPALSPRQTDDMLPELDLLDQTLRLRGVAQLESSRGCSYACSFCPRNHKGIWAGDDPQSLDAVLPDITRLLKRYA